MLKNQIATLELNSECNTLFPISVLKLIREMKVSLLITFFLGIACKTLKLAHADKLLSALADNSEKKRGNRFLKGKKKVKSRQDVPPTVLRQEKSFMIYSRNLLVQSSSPSVMVLPLIMTPTIMTPTR